MAYTTKRLLQPVFLAGSLMAASSCEIIDEVGRSTGAETAGVRGGGSDAGTPPATRAGCSYTQGFWKNHPDAWPVTQLQLGSRTYDKAQLLAILKKEVDGNGLLALAHQLIAARLNIAAGAASTSIDGTLAQADALIGALVIPPVGDGRLPSSQTSKLNDALTSFNEGKVGPGHCEHGGGPKPPVSPPGGSTPYPPGTPNPPPATDAGVPPGGSTPYPPGNSDPPPASDAGVPPGGSTPYPQPTPPTPPIVE